MVALYVRGKKVELADLGRVFADSATSPDEIEFRNEAGELVKRFVSHSAVVRDEDPDWVKAITPATNEEALKAPFLTLEEYRKQMGQS